MGNMDETQLHRYLASVYLQGANFGSDTKDVTRSTLRQNETESYQNESRDYLRKKREAEKSPELVAQQVIDAYNHKPDALKKLDTKKINIVGENGLPKTVDAHILSFPYYNDLIPMGLNDETGHENLSQVYSYGGKFYKMNYSWDEVNKTTKPSSDVFEITAKEAEGLRNKTIQKARTQKAFSGEQNPLDYTQEGQQNTDEATTKEAMKKELEKLNKNGVPKSKKQ